MGILTSFQSEIAIPARCVVGRARFCALQPDDSRVSGEHARLMFRDGTWWIRDLGSRNGTFVNGRRIDPGSEHVLSLNDVVTFGSVDALEWTLSESGPPSPLARSVPSGTWVRGLRSQIWLPSVADPIVTIVDDGATWVLEGDGPRREVRDGDRLEVDGETFELMLPEAVTQTDETVARQIAGSRFLFRVSSDEEHVELDVVSERETHRTGDRAHNEVLLALARLRIDDRSRGLGASDEGWVYVDELVRMLRSDREKINLDIFRARQTLMDLGYCDAVGLVERRRSVRQLRIGVRDVEVVRC